MSITVIKNIAKAVICLDSPEILENVDIVLNGSRITAVGPGAGEESIPTADKVLDGSECVVMPGIVCSHHHYYSGLSRGIMAKIGPTPDFISTLKELWWKIDRALDEDSVYFSSLVCSMDAIKSGTTAVIDHHSSPAYISGSLQAIKRGMIETGLRGMTCYEVTNRNNGDREIEQGVEENLRFALEAEAEKQNDSENHLVEASIGGHAPFTISDHGLELMSEAVDKSGRGIHMHVAEDLYDASVSHHLHGKDLIVRLNDFGLINDKALLVHGLYLSNEDLEILNIADGFLLHNARSNMNNNVGYAKMLPAVQNLALGTDGIGADMFEELKFAFFKNRDAGGIFWPADFLKALHKGNTILQRYFDDSFGRLAVGNKADIVITDYTSPTPLTAENLAGHMAFGLSSGCVKTVIINGRVVYENREFPFDAAEIYAKAAEQAEKVWKRMDTLH